MKKVVYNDCFGGFAISRACAEFMAGLGNQEAMELLNIDDEELAAYDDFEHVFYGRLSKTPRHDAILLLAIEELGSERASGDPAKLVVHELREDRYIIKEYDGMEHVVEPHTISWVTA